MQLVTVLPSHQLAPDAAASVLRMFAAGCPQTITEAWRSSETQAVRRASYLAGTGAFALPPGQSKHEVGLAVDWGRAAATWVRAHPDFGWRFTNGDEWWHTDYFVTLDRHLIDRTAPQLTAPAALELAPEQESVMIYRAKGTHAFIFDGWTYLQGADGVLRPLSAKEYQARAWADPDVKVAEWSAEDLYDLALRCGMYAFAGTAADRDPLGLLGTVIGRNATATAKGGCWS